MFIVRLQPSPDFFDSRLVKRAARRQTRHTRRAVLGNPLHPYTQKLLSAVPIADPQERNLLKLLNLSDLPSPVRKVGDDPVIEPLVEVEPGHFVAKHIVGTMEGHK